MQMSSEIGTDSSFWKATNKTKSPIMNTSPIGEEIKPLARTNKQETGLPAEGSTERLELNITNEKADLLYTKNHVFKTNELLTLAEVEREIRTNPIKASKLDLIAATILKERPKKRVVTLLTFRFNAAIHLNVLQLPENGNAAQ